MEIVWSQTGVTRVQRALDCSGLIRKYPPLLVQAHISTAVPLYTTQSWLVEYERSTITNVFKVIGNGNKDGENRYVLWFVDLIESNVNNMNNVPFLERVGYIRFL